MKNKVYFDFKKQSFLKIITETKYWCTATLKKKQYSYLDVDTKRAEEQRVVITEQKEYMEWKKNFLLQKYKEEKELRETEYNENKLRLDEKHCLEMKVLKLKEMKLLRDLGLESNEQ